MGREEFTERLARRFEEGREAIVLWYENMVSGVTFANLMVGAENAERLESENETVKQYGTEIIF